MSLCVRDDFNVVRFPFEKMGSFNYVVDELQLMDLPMQGGSFTWSNGQSASRTNQFLVSEDWEEHFLILLNLV